MLRCSLELSEFDIRYEGRKAMNTQALADFVAEMTFKESPTKTLKNGSSTSMEHPTRRVGAQA